MLHGQNKVWVQLFNYIICPEAALLLRLTAQSKDAGFHEVQKEAMASLSPALSSCGQMPL